MKLKGILSCVLLGVISLSGCGPSYAKYYIVKCTNAEHGEDGHFIETNGKDFYDLVIFTEPDSGEPDNKPTTALLIYDENCESCQEARNDLSYYTRENQVDMYYYDLTSHFEGTSEDDKTKSDEEIEEIREDYDYLYQAVAWLYDGPNYTDPLIPEWKEGEDSSTLEFTTPNVIVFDNNTGATAVLPVGDTDYLGYFEKHFVVIDGYDELGNPIVSEDKE